MSWSPAISHPWPWFLAVALPLLGGWLAWRANAPLTLANRSWLVLLRVLVFTALVLLLLNPGHWQQPEQEESKLHAVLLDRSASMAVRDVGNQSRWERGLEVVRVLHDQGGEAVKGFTFADRLEGDPLTAGVKPDGAASALVRSGIGLFSGASGLGRKLASVTIVSDGRQTTDDAASELVLRAQASRVPVHVVPLGGDWGGRDLIVRAARKLVVALPEKPVIVRALVESRGLGRLRPVLQLLDEAGKAVAEREVELDQDAKVPVTIEVPSLPGGEYRLVVAPQSGEDVTRNNEDHVRVQELPGRTRVFIAEGAPYWDSKFLAQLLREQGFMDVRAVYRLNAERYFRVDGGASEAVGEGETVFPESAEDFAKLDLIVLGKGAEGFLIPARIAALKSFVRDRGGALLLARGKPYAGELRELETLEPVEWGTALDGEFRFEPGSLGEAAGLFGQVLPAAADPMWRQLPVLKDLTAITRLKPFSQVLAVGARPAVGHEERVPLLVARHFGAGVVVTMNADGLWRWDFDPQARKLGNMYEEFWTQLLQWTASYAEFLPGQELSLRLSESSVKQGRAVRTLIGWRGGNALPQPKVKLFEGKAEVAALAASEGETDAEGRRSWTALVQPERAGIYRVQVFNGDVPGPEAVLQVQAPPTEQESLAADPEFLRRLAAETQGEVWQPAQAGELAGRLFAQPPPQVQEAGRAEWQPAWPRGWVLGALVGMMGIEWWARRRRGLL